MPADLWCPRKLSNCPN